MTIDKNSDDWRQVREFCEKRIAEMREQNDNDLGKKETARLRGNIAFAEEVLNLDKVEIRPDIQSNEYID